MNILAIDTTSEHGSLALRSDGRLLAELDLHSTEGYSRLLFAGIAELLRNNGMGLGEIDCFAAACGPGAFTGVRVCLAAAKGLAEANGKPAAGVSNLRALATFGKSTRRATVLDARRGDVFAAVYDDGLNLISPEVVVKLQTWACNPEEYIVSAGFDLTASLPQKIVVAPLSLAAAVALCAEHDGSDGWTDPAALDANYVRRSDAELLWHDVAR